MNIGRAIVFDWQIFIAGTTYSGNRSLQSGNSEGLNL